MPPDEKLLLEKTFELEKENNILLRYIKRSLHISSIMSVIYWVFIIGTAVGAFYLLQPYWDKVVHVYDKASNIINGIGN